jgi:hypothetical protein
VHFGLKTYRREIARMMGADIMEKGFNVTLIDSYDGQIFEIEEAK